ncbi:MAG: flagellar basal body protein, partial [Treponema sp.]|nr:flagellar basal body protein [Treponema sp.]
MSSGYVVSSKTTGGNVHGHRPRPLKICPFFSDIYNEEIRTYMMRSLFSGVSGLQNHQTRMDVVGNNIS